MSQTLLLGRKLNDDIVLPVAVDASGFLLVSNTNQPYLATLTDVSLNGVTNRQVLMYDTPTNLWKNRTIQTSDLSGQITNAQLQNSSITLNGVSTSLGGTRTIAFSELAGVSLSGLTTNDTLRYNGTNWINARPDYFTNAYSGQLRAATVTTGTEFSIIGNTNWTTFSPSIENSNVLTLTAAGAIGSMTSTKLYRFEIRVNFNTGNIASTTRWDLTLRSTNVIGTLLKTCACNAVNDYVMPTLSLSWIGTGQPAICPTLKYTGTGFTNIALDCQVDLIVCEIV